MAANEYLPLNAVAERAHVSVRSLREWCATGRLVCERVGGEWAVSATEIEQVRRLAARENPPVRRATLVLPSEVATREAAQEVVRALGVPDRHVVKAALTIDFMEYVAFTADTDPEAIEAARVVVERLGGQLLDP